MAERLGTELERAQHRAIEIAVSVMDAEVAYQLQGFVDPETGLSPRRVADVMSTYSRVNAEGTKKGRQPLRDRLVVHSVDTLWAVTRAVKAGLVTSEAEVARLAGAIAADEYLPPSNSLSYLRGTSSWLEHALSAPTLAGALEVHTHVNDELLEDDTAITLPSVVRAAGRFGIDLSRESIALDEGAVQLVLANVEQYSFTKEIARATRDGVPYHSFHAVDAAGLRKVRSDSVVGSVSGDRADDPSLGVPYQGTGFADAIAEDPENAAWILLYADEWTS